MSRYRHQQLARDTRVNSPSTARAPGRLLGIHTSMRIRISQPTHWLRLSESTLRLWRRMAVWRRFARPPSFAAGCALVGLTVSGCGGEPGAPRCVEVTVEPCDELYPPTWENVYTNTLIPKCAAGSGACHTSSDATGAGGGLFFDTPAASHARLLAGEWVVAQDAVCSPVVVRIETDDENLRMPPGQEPLDPRERCSIRHWIAEGAMP